jgi:hypothetical protein
MEVIFAAWIDSHIAILTLHFLAENDGINCQLMDHHKSSYRKSVWMAYRL